MPIHPHDNGLALSLFKGSLSAPWGWHGVNPDKDFPGQSGQTHLPIQSRAQRSHKTPSPRKAALVMTFSHVEHWDASRVVLTEPGHAEDTCQTHPSPARQQSPHEVSASFLQVLLAVTYQQETKFVFFKRRNCWLECLWCELDGSDEGSQWSSCWYRKTIKKQVVLTELAKLFLNAWIFTQTDLENLKSAMVSPASS